ncbi:MAG: alpha/beta hydrolase [Panacagrimonas sp.]
MSTHPSEAFTDESDRPVYEHLVQPRGGWLARLWVNLLLRVLVKWTGGLRINIGELRQRQLDFGRRLARLPPGVRRESENCDGVPAEWLIPQDAVDERVLLYVHGGAFVARSPDLHTTMVAPWCRELRTRALLVDYRLAPEHPYPAGLDDVYRAYRWLLARGHLATQIALAGDSAGGNLVLALLHRLKAAGEPLPSCAVLLSPFVDFTLSSPSIVSESRRDPLFTTVFALAIRGLYAPPERLLDSGVSPLYADFRGLPPLLVQVGSTEMLLDDSRRTATRAHEAGVDVCLEVWDRMPHVFQALPMLPQAHEAGRRIVDFIAKKSG